MKIGKLIRNEYPIGLIVDIHDYCNASCKMCPYESLKRKLNQGRMDWKWRWTPVFGQPEGKISSESAY